MVLLKSCYGKTAILQLKIKLLPFYVILNTECDSSFCTKWRKFQFLNCLLQMYLDIPSIFRQKYIKFGLLLSMWKSLFIASISLLNVYKIPIFNFIFQLSVFLNILPHLKCFNIIRYVRNYIYFSLYNSKGIFNRLRDGFCNRMNKIKLYKYKEIRVLNSILAQIRTLFFHNLTYIEKSVCKGMTDTLVNMRKKKLV